MFRRMLEHAVDRPAEFMALASDLFRPRKSGGRIGFEPVGHLGGLIGVVCGVGGAWLMRRVALPSSGLYPLAVLSLAFTAYGAAAAVHASGFAAIYVAALILGNSELPHRVATRAFERLLTATRSRLVALAWTAPIMRGRTATDMTAKRNIATTISTKLTPACPSPGLGESRRVSIAVTSSGERGAAGARATSGPSEAVWSSVSSRARRLRPPRCRLSRKPRRRPCQWWSVPCRTCRRPCPSQP